MASLEAVERRRAARRNKYLRKLENDERQREIALRMNTRFFPDGPINLIHLDIRYWHARRCGWDIDKDGDTVMGLDAEGNPVRFWDWWCCMDYKSRRHLMDLSRECAPILQELNPVFKKEPIQQYVAWRGSS